ncbi:MAG: polysaccharide deacetylase family protein [Candidatus Gribaldobacteria bacterium]|nr:polysaccharide deacetylase family protein [Candidatus Gribaldobacteria bacterium]
MNPLVVRHLAFHYVVPEGTRPPGMSCTPQRLEEHIKWLQENEFEIMTCGEVGNYLTEDDITLLRKHATLSFDDSTRDHYTNVLPILKKYGVKGTFFVPTCILRGIFPPVMGLQFLIKEKGAETVLTEVLPNILKGTFYSRLLEEGVLNIPDDYRNSGESDIAGKIKTIFNDTVPPHLQIEAMEEALSFYFPKVKMEDLVADWFANPSQLRTMGDAGMEIASHTVNHQRLGLMSRDEVCFEAEKSNSDLFTFLRIRTGVFGWTFGGEFKSSIKGGVKRSYKTAWNFYHSLEEVPEGDIYADWMNIPRVNEAAYRLD